MRLTPTSIYRLVRVLEIDSVEKRKVIWRGVGGPGLCEVSLRYPKFWSWCESYDFLAYYDYFALDNRQCDAILSDQCRVRYYFEARHRDSSYEQIDDPRLLECCVPQAFASNWGRDRPQCAHGAEHPLRARKHIMYVNGTPLTSMRGYYRNSLVAV